MAATGRYFQTVLKNVTKIGWQVKVFAVHDPDEWYSKLADSSKYNNGQLMWNSMHRAKHVNQFMVLAVGVSLSHNVWVTIHLIYLEQCRTKDELFSQLKSHSKSSN